MSLKGSRVPPVPTTTMVPVVQYPAQQALIDANRFDFGEVELERPAVDQSDLHDHPPAGDGELRGGVADQRADEGDDQEERAPPARRR